MKKTLENKGITLIALVITIILLIILSGIAINISIGENGIFNKVQEAKEKYTVESIREKVEIGIMEQEIEEIALGNPVTIELILQELVENGIFESIDKDASIGNIGEYEVKLKYNEEGKVLIEYIQKATGVRTTWSLNPKGYTNGDKVSILLTVQGKVKSVTKPDGLVMYSEKETLSIAYEVIANGTYTFIVEDEKGNKQEKNVIVDTIDKLAPNDFEIRGECVGHTITVSGETQDEIATETSVCSGIKRYEYYIKLQSEGTYTKKDTNVIEVKEDGLYNVYVVAYDKAENSKQSNTLTVVVDSSWEELNKIAKAISDTNLTTETEEGEIKYTDTEATVTVDGVEKTVKVGDIYNVYYGTTIRRVRIIGFNHDLLKDSAAYGGTNLYAGITFDFVDFMTGTTQMQLNPRYETVKGTYYPSGHYIGGWGDCKMRSVLNGYARTNSVIADEQNKDIAGWGANLSNKSYIKQVEKYYYPSGRSTARNTSEDYLWLLSFGEIWSSSASGYSAGTEGEQYKWYNLNELGGKKSYETNNPSFEKSSKPGAAPTNWWTRSGEHGSDGRGCYVGSQGRCLTNSVYPNNGVAPGFCI